MQPNESSFGGPYNEQLSGKWTNTKMAEMDQSLRSTLSTGLSTKSLFRTFFKKWMNIPG